MKTIRSTFTYILVCLISLTNISLPMYGEEPKPEPDLESTENVHAETEVTTKVRHRPAVGTFAPGNRIKVRAEVKDKQGVKTVRCYFRATEDEEFVFVEMSNTEKNWYEGVLPAPAETAASFTYLFLIVNENNMVVRTQNFTSTAVALGEDLPKWQSDLKEGVLEIYSELEGYAEKISGFTDNYTVKLVQNTYRYGKMATDLYQLQSAGATASSSTSATSGGTVQASTSFVSGTTMGIAGGVVAAGVGAAAAGGGGSGGGGGGTSENPFVGVYDLDFGDGLDDRLTIFENGTASVFIEYEDGSTDTFSESWTISGNQLTVGTGEFGSVILTNNGGNISGINTEGIFTVRKI